MDLPDLYRPHIQSAAEFYFGIPAPIPALVAQMRQESSFDTNAKSRTGALGLYQFMPGTAKFAAQAGGFGLAAPKDPEWSIRAGVWYMRFLYDRVHYTSECDRYGAALSCFNGGLGWHNKRQSLAGKPDDFWFSVRVVNPGITASNQNENESYAVDIIYKWQLRYLALGKRVCL